MWNIKTRVVPIVIGGLGATSNNLEKHPEEIPGKKNPAKCARSLRVRVRLGGQRKTLTSTQELSKEQETIITNIGLPL